MTRKNQIIELGAIVAWLRKQVQALEHQLDAELRAPAESTDVVWDIDVPEKDIP